jgi:uncharacterized membrane protein
MPKTSIKTKIKKNIIAGLLVVIPTGLTFFLFSFINSRLDESLVPLINNLILKTGIEIPNKFYLPGTGFFILFLLIVTAGLFATNWYGKKFVGLGDIFVQRIPFVRTIYITIKKLVVTFSETGTPKFQKAVVLDYPREGLQSLGIICCDAFGEIENKLGGNFVNVFVPTTPNPTTGFTVILPKEKIIPLDFPVDQGLKMIVSVGMYNPEIPKDSAKADL